MSELNLKRRIKALDWMHFGWWSPLRLGLRDVGRIVADRICGGYQQTSCHHCGGPWYALGTCCEVRRLSSVRGLPARAGCKELAAFCMRCGHIERKALGPEDLAYLHSITRSPDTCPMNMDDLLAVHEETAGTAGDKAALARRDEVLRAQIKQHQDAIAQLQGQLVPRAIASGAPYRPLTTLGHAARPGPRDRNLYTVRVGICVSLLLAGAHLVVELGFPMAVLFVLPVLAYPVVWAFRSGSGSK